MYNYLQRNSTELLQTLFDIVFLPRNITRNAFYDENNRRHSVVKAVIPSNAPGRVYDLTDNMQYRYMPKHCSANTYYSISQVCKVFFVPVMPVCSSVLYWQSTFICVVYRSGCLPTRQEFEYKTSLDSKQNDEGMISVLKTKQHLICVVCDKT